MPDTPVVETSDNGFTDERVVYGMHARQVNTGQWRRGFAFVLSLGWFCVKSGTSVVN